MRRNPKLIENLRTKLKKHGFDPDTIDYIAYIDTSLTENENWEILKDEFKISEPIAKKVINAMQIDHIAQVNGEIMQKTHDDLITTITENAKVSTPLLEKLFDTPIFWVKLVGQGFRHALILEGEYGLAKSRITLNTLSSMGGIKFEYINGHVTPYALAKLLYEHRDIDIIVIDDVDELLRNPITKAMLKQALDTNGARTCRWDSTKSELPKQWEITARIILIGNNFPEDMNFEAVKDRCFYYKFDLRYEDKIKVMAELTKLPYKDLTDQDRIDVFNYILDHSSNATENFSLRILEKMMDIFGYCKKHDLDFKLYAKDILKEDPKLRLLKDLQLEPVKEYEKVKKWIEATGLQRRSYYYLKNKLVQ